MFALLMGLRSISCNQVLDRLPQRNLTVIDVNDPSRWQRAHVPGALNLDPSLFTASELPADRSAALAFYCSGPLCRKAPRAAKRAKAMGYCDVRVMSAGIEGWLAAGLPVASGDERMPG